jgi:beta-glucosidase
MMILKLSAWFSKRVEKSLLPRPSGKGFKFFHYLFQAVTFSILVIPCSLLALMVLFLKRLWLQQEEKEPLLQFYKKPTWKNCIEELPAIDIGFATCDFQENGPRFHGSSNWGEFMKESEESHFPGLWKDEDILDHIHRLKAMNVRHFRFSISRDTVEPEPGKFDEEALDHYRQLLRTLQEHGITPFVLLHHFTDPLWFTKSGGWENQENIEGFVLFAEKVCALLFEEGVRKISTFNEPGILFSQGYFLGFFPPGRALKLKQGTLALENILRAHTRVYEKIKHRHPELEIGITHNPMRYQTYHYWNLIGFLIEKPVCHYFTEIYHAALLRFYKTGTFELRVPFLVNHTFSLGKPLPMDFYGMQYYCDPLLKSSLRRGLESTGFNEEEAVTSCDYRAFPQGLAGALHEARGLGVPIEITEVGIDTGINQDLKDQERIRYFDRIFQVIMLAAQEGINVRALYFWTTQDNFEWHKEWNAKFGFYSFDPQTKISTPRPAALWLKNLLQPQGEAPVVEQEPAETFSERS